jgi:hypothetical protein
MLIIKYQQNKEYLVSAENEAVIAQPVSTARKTGRIIGGFAGIVTAVIAVTMLTNTDESQSANNTRHIFYTLFGLSGLAGGAFAGDLVARLATAFAPPVSDEDSTSGEDPVSVGDDKLSRAGATALLDRRSDGLEGLNA